LGDWPTRPPSSRARREAGADALVFPLSRGEATAELKAALSKPIVVLGAPIPGAACTLHTGWGWLGAAAGPADPVPRRISRSPCAS
jgi:hypothetical protein